MVVVFLIAYCAARGGGLMVVFLFGVGVSCGYVLRLISGEAVVWWFSLCWFWDCLGLWVVFAFSLGWIWFCVWVVGCLFLFELGS